MVNLSKAIIQNMCNEYQEFPTKFHWQMIIQMLVTYSNLEEIKSFSGYKTKDQFNKALNNDSNLVLQYLKELGIEIAN